MLALLMHEANIYLKKYILKQHTHKCNSFYLNPRLNKLEGLDHTPTSVNAIFDRDQNKYYNSLEF